MKKIIFCVVTVFTSLCMQGSWKIGAIHNNSDLVLESAWYVKSGKKKPREKFIDILSDRLARAKKSGQSSITFDYKIGRDASGCSLIKAQGGYQLSFDYALPYRIHYPKTKQLFSQKHNIGKSACDPGKDTYCARVFLEKGDKLITSTAHAYQTENDAFDIYLSGEKGVYSIVLKSKG